MHELTNNRRTWGRCALLAGVLLGCTLLIRPYIWLRVPGAVVTFDGRGTTLASIYRSFDGQLLVWIREPGGAMPYVIRASEGTVLLPNAASLLDDNPDDGHWLVTACFALSREAHPCGLVLGSMDFSTVPHLVIQPGYIEFTEENLARGRRGWVTRRVHVTL